jgi:hypothetical protein
MPPKSKKSTHNRYPLRKKKPPTTTIPTNKEGAEEKAEKQTKTHKKKEESEGSTSNKSIGNHPKGGPRKRPAAQKHLSSSDGDQEEEELSTREINKKQKVTHKETEEIAIDIIKDLPNIEDRETLKGIAIELKKEGYKKITESRIIYASRIFVEARLGRIHPKCKELFEKRLEIYSRGETSPALSNRIHEAWEELTKEDAEK